MYIKKGRLSDKHVSFEQCVIKAESAVHESRCEDILPKHTDRYTIIHEDRSEHDPIISNGILSGRYIL